MKMAVGFLLLFGPHSDPLPSFSLYLPKVSMPDEKHPFTLEEAVKVGSMSQRMVTSDQ